ncbi:hypothetical protein [Rhodocytophaga rosea]
MKQPVPKHIKAFDCAFQVRPGPIIKSGTSDYWYRIDSTTEITALIGLIHHHITDYILPFYNQYKSLFDLLKLQEVDTTFGEMIQIQVGLTLAKKGDYKLAKKEINSYLQSGKRSEDWIDRIKSEAIIRGLEI